MDYMEGLSKIKSATQFGSVAGSTRLGVFELDFGWGRPAKTEVLSIDRSEGFSIWERRDKPGGVEMGLCLKKSEMNIFLSLFRNGLKD
uniref:Phenolic glucoside malonyltransferase 2 n=1 Tax=Noccaea caerulescens TaxID=107243 RepID=A0A1J3EW42_NOCCA